MGCLFALLAVFAPRLAFLVIWIFDTNLVNNAFNTFFFPLLGFIFLPFTTLFYVLAVGPLGGTSFWGWLFVFIGFMLDLGNYHHAYEDRSYIDQYTGTSK
jgi:hypothetical protein